MLLLTVSFVIFGPNVAQMHGKRNITGVQPALDAALVVCMAILGTEWVLKLMLLPQPGLLLIAMDAVMVSQSFQYRHNVCRLH